VLSYSLTEPVGPRMKILSIPLALWLLGAAAFSGPAALQTQKKDSLSPEYKAWLEDVEPIITPLEREVFLGLATRQERDTFVRFFWRARDPLPDTPENEFRKEYEARIRFADQDFGRGTSRRGSRTDRGFYYLLLGPPLERQRFATQSELWPVELWFYKGETEYGLPPYFYLVFFQPEGIGDYRLYSPGIDGPEKLVVPGFAGRGLGRAAAAGIIRKTSSELASASLSYLAGEGSTSGGAFSSDNIIAAVKSLPEKKVSDGYARSYRTFKDHIETEYSDRYLASAFLLKVFREGDQSFLHWSIEPEKMNFGELDGMIYAAFEFVLRMEDAEGRVVYEKSEEIPVRMTPEQYKAHERRRFAFQDLLPVVPGEHKLLLLLKNKTGRDFSSQETRIVIPAGDAPGFSSLLLHHGEEPVPEAQRTSLKAFTFGGSSYPVTARNEFLPDETLGVFVQAFLPDKLVPGGEPSFVLEIFSAETAAREIQVPLPASGRSGAGGETVLLEKKVGLSSLKPGYYRVEVSAVAPDGSRVLTQKENFILLSQPHPVLPWVYARLHGPFPGAEHLFTLGSQYFLTGDYELAKDALERALALKDVPAVRLLLAKALYGMGRFRESLDSALGLFERTEDREAGKVVALSYAGLEDWTSALAALEKLMAGATEIGVLNLAAECQMNLGRPDLALPLLQKSLELLPDQPAIKALEERAKKLLDIKKRASFF
jgi:GWxTD domain-containing protein